MSTVTHTQRPTEQHLTIRTHIYEAAADLYPGRDDYDDFELRAIRNEAIERCGMGTGKAAPNAFRKDYWLNWLLTPSRYSPFVDEVAVERALEFDVSALESLSDLEWFRVVDTLAAMDDPFEAADARREGGNAVLDAGFMSDVRRRLRDLPPVLYRKLQGAVYEARTRAQAA